MQKCGPVEDLRSLLSPEGRSDCFYLKQRSGLVLGVAMRFEKRRRVYSLCLTAPHPAALVSPAPKLQRALQQVPEGLLARSILQTKNPFGPNRVPRAKTGFQIMVLALL